MLVVPAPFVETTIFPPLGDLGTFVKDVLTTDGWVFLVCSFPVIRVPNFMPLPHHFDGSRFKC